MTKHYNMIACDGGGIRGLMTAQLIDDLVSNPPPGVSSDILSNVSLYAGTSTGGIIAIGLACGVLPSVLATLYEHKCHKIFQLYQPDGTISSAVARLQSASPQLESVLCDVFPEFCHVKYTNTGLYDELHATLSTKVTPDDPLSSLSASVLVTTFMMSDAKTDPWGPLALTNLPNSPYADVPIIDAAMCSAAAPIYFPPYPFTVTGEPTKWCADGGVFANNPSTYALANVLEFQVLKQNNMTLSSVMLLSIGTGNHVDTVPPTDFGKSSDWGMYKWLDPFAVAPEPEYPLMAAMFDAQSQMADFEAANILGGNNYRRANPPLGPTVNLADCAGIPALMEAASSYISSTEWIEIKKWAYQNFV